MGAPTDDDDGDAHPNEEEWMAGTDPRDAASRLELQWKAVSGNTIDLEWPARPGGRYTILQADHPGLQKPVTMPGDVIMGTAPRMTRTIPVPAGTTRRFFAVFCW